MFYIANEGLSVLISIHPPLAGRDLAAPKAAQAEKVFQSTRPLRGGTLDDGGGGSDAMISIHPPLAGRDSKLA